MSKRDKRPRAKSQAGYPSLSEGTDLATLTDGGACRYFVNVVAYCEDSYYGVLGDVEGALAVCRARLAQLDYATLAAVKSGQDSEPLRQAELQLVEDAEDEINCQGYYDDYTVTVTLLELIA